MTGNETQRRGEAWCIKRGVETGGQAAPLIRWDTCSPLMKLRKLDTLVLISLHCLIKHQTSQHQKHYWEVIYATFSLAMVTWLKKDNPVDLRYWNIFPILSVLLVVVFLLITLLSRAALFCTSGHILPCKDLDFPRGVWQELTIGVQHRWKKGQVD